ncbi:MAG: glycosyl transferase, family 9 [uncultured Corynebacteriales bacterium]|uniref:Glycosyl transferase, family 9 n=1 Tax=uncultured Mycobacteriales bacterium TaxID=581187 RepID=A0A6J4HE02_9ACTN|nr:MAG: glycosyl transferase, family 9 [uncultured Corynebacteriales bacterium]
MLLRDPDVRTVLLVRLRVGLGDLLCGVPALRALRAARPDLHVALLTWAEMEPVVARFGAYVDELVPFPGWPGIPERPPRDPAGFLAAVRARRFDAALQVYGDRPAANEVTEAVGARRVGGFHDPARHPADPATHLPYPASMHEVHRHLSLFQHLGVPPAGEDLEFPVTAADRAEAAPLARGRYAVLHPGATSSSRRWPLRRWAEVGDALARSGLRVLVTGVPGEEELTAAVVGGMREPAVDACGATSLGGFAALLAGAVLLVSNDTGAAHLAVAVRTPSVTVFLSGDPRRWAGLPRDRHRVVRADVGCNPCPHLDCPIDHRCADRIPVGAVLDQVALLPAR